MTKTKTKAAIVDSIEDRRRAKPTSLASLVADQRELLIELTHQFLSGDPKSPSDEARLRALLQLCTRTVFQTKWTEPMHRDRQLDILEALDQEDPGHG